MSKDSTLKASQADWAAVEAMTDEEIDLSEIPEIRADQIAQATLRVGGKPVAREKVRVNIYLDAEVIAYFKALAGGRGYQTLINETLKESMQAKGLETMLRRVIQEELKAVG